MSDDEEEVTIKMICQKRWTPQILSMLKYMEYLGNVGSSRTVSLLSDGDGDFHPKFDFSIEFESVAPLREQGGSHHYDAG